MRSRSTVAAVSIAAFLGGGCGSDADDASPAGGDAADVRAIRAVVDEANVSFAEGDYARTCRQYTERAQRLIMDGTSATTCEQAWERTATVMRETMTAAQVTATTEYGVDSVSVDGDVATAVYGEPPAAIRDLPTVQAGLSIRVLRVDGTWKIDSLPAP